MTRNASLSKLLTKKPQDRKERDAEDQRLKSFPDLVPFAPSHLIHISTVGFLFFVFLFFYLISILWRSSGDQSLVHIGFLTAP